MFFWKFGPYNAEARSFLFKALHGKLKAPMFYGIAAIPGCSVISLLSPKMLNAFSLSALGSRVRLLARCRLQDGIAEGLREKTQMHVRENARDACIKSKAQHISTRHDNNALS